MFQDSTFNRSNYINQNIYERNIPSYPLKPLYGMSTPISTKYQVMPTIVQKKQYIESLNTYPLYSNETIYYTGNRKAPDWQNKVDIESELRNQIYALQNSPQNTWVPNSSSSLYSHTFTNSHLVQQPHIYLFNNEDFAKFNPNPHNLGYQLFGNNTRIQLKEIPK